MSEELENVPENKAISGTPIRIVAIILAIAIIIGMSVLVGDFSGFLIGAVLGGIIGLLVDGFATIVDACHKYLNEQ